MLTSILLRSRKGYSETWVKTNKIKWSETNTFKYKNNKKNKIKKNKIKIK